MKNLFYILIFLPLLNNIYSAEIPFISLNYENSYFLGDNLENTKEVSLGYSMWRFEENGKYPSALIIISYGDFENNKLTKSNKFFSIGYEQKYEKKINKYLNQNLSLGLKYRFFDFKYLNPQSYNNESFNGDSIDSLNTYIYYGYSINTFNNLSIDFGLSPQLLFFKSSTRRGLENNYLKNTIGIGYKIGFTYKF